jgi:hypothetical protein
LAKNVCALFERQSCFRLRERKRGTGREGEREGEREGGRADVRM